MRTAICTVFVICGLVAPAGAQQPHQPPFRSASSRPSASPSRRRSILSGASKRSIASRSGRASRGSWRRCCSRRGTRSRKAIPSIASRKGCSRPPSSRRKAPWRAARPRKRSPRCNSQRAEDLLAKNAGTAVARDQALAADEQAKGQILSDEASLDTAKINLGYTEIVAPVSGRIGRTNITKGNVVGPDSGPLTVVVSQDPMYVTFPVSQREFLRAQEDAHQIDLKAIKARASLCRRQDLRPDRPDQFRRRDGRSRHRHRAGARHFPQSGRRTDRRPARARDPRKRHTQGDGRRSAICADRRPGRRLRLRGRGRQGRREADQARR